MKKQIFLFAEWNWKGGKTVYAMTIVPYSAKLLVFQLRKSPAKIFSTPKASTNTLVR